MIVNLDRTDICNMLSGVEPSYEEMDRLERIGLGYYVGGFNDEWHWNGTRFADFSDEQLLEIYKSLK